MRITNFPRIYAAYKAFYYALRYKSFVLIASDKGIIANADNKLGVYSVYLLYKEDYTLFAHRCIVNVKEDAPANQTN